MLRKKQAGLSARLVQFLLDDPEPLLYHNEPIWRDGKVAGYLSSGNYGHHLGAAVGLGYVKCATGESADALLASRYEIEVAGQPHPRQSQPQGPLRSQSRTPADVRAARAVPVLSVILRLGGLNRRCLDKVCDEAIDSLGGRVPGAHQAAARRAEECVERPALCAQAPPAPWDRCRRTPHLPRPET